MSAPNFTTHFIRTLFRELGSDAKLDEFGVDPTAVMPSISNNKDFARDYLLYNVSRKRDVHEKESTPASILQNSLTKWTDAEYSCRVINQHHRYYSALREDENLFDALYERSKFHIARILCDQWPDYATAGYTGGATNHLPRAYSLAAAKWIGYARSNRNQSVVPNATAHLSAILEQNPALSRRLYRKRWNLVDETLFPQEDYADFALDSFSTDPVSSTAVLEFVPKDVKSVRVIMKTGEGTMLCQSVFGSCIRRALAEEGVDLQDQNINREWAEIGSLTGLVATVDLSSASDTISQGIVKRLLPPRWYTWLDSCRDTHIQNTNGKTHELEKFASMGNGFCFELESLIFYAMSLAVCDVLKEDTSFVSVYGDDIIIPTRCYDTLNKFFLHAGFFLNQEKTFAGPQGFRESCGGHYYKGKDVTPFYVKGNIETISDCFHVLNQLMSWSNRTGISVPITIDMLLKRIPLKDRVIIPSTYSTRAGLHFSIEGAVYPTIKWNANFQRFTSRLRVLKETYVNDTEKWCGRTLLMQWFMLSEVPGELEVNLVDTKISRNSSLFTKLCRTHNGFLLHKPSVSVTINGSFKSLKWSITTA